MTPVFQTHFEEEGTGPGNCMQASVASLFNVPLDYVPNFILDKDPFAAFREYMRICGYSIVKMPPEFVPTGIYFLTGISNRGHEHMALGYAGQLMFDPNPHGKPGFQKVDAVYWPVPSTDVAAELLQ